MTIEEYWAEVEVECKNFPDKRPGQNAFHVLWAHRPNLAVRIQATEYDPYYSTLPLNGLKYNLFGAFLLENW